MRDLLKMVRRWLRRLGIAVLLLVALAVGGFGALQTPFGRDWLGGVIADAASGPGFAVAIEGIDGFVPFQMTARRITIADDRGVWLALSNVMFDLSPAELAAGRARVRTLTAAAVDVARLPAASPDSAPPLPLSDRLKVPRLPLPVTIDRLAIDRITLDPSIIGDKVEASLAGSASAIGLTLEAALDLHRTDGNPGSLAFRFGLSGTPAVLTLRLTADEPTGALLGRLLHRDDRPPLALSLAGDGPVGAWRGRLEASSGSLARFDAELSLFGADQTRIALSGIAAVDRLLPPDLAKLIGERVPVALRMTVEENGAIVLDNLSVELASGTLAGDARLAGAGHALTAHLRAKIPRLAVAGDALGVAMAGSVEVSATISGTEDRPIIDLHAVGGHIAAAAFGVDHAEAHLTVTPTASIGDPAARLDIAARGSVRGVTSSGANVLTAAVGRDLSWSLAATAAPDGSAVVLTELSAHGVGVDLAGSGVLDQARGTLDGRIRLSVDDLRRFAGLTGHPIEGALTLDATARQRGPDPVAVQIDGSIVRLRTGVPVIDALAGEQVAITGSGRRDPSGVLRIERLTLSGGAANLVASGHFDPRSRQVAATLDAEIRQLQPLGVALDTRLSGHLTARVSAEGPVDHARVRAQLDGEDVAAGPAIFDRLRLDAAIADLAQPQVAVTGKFRGGGIDGTLAVDVDLTNRGDLAIRQLQVTAAGGVVDGDLRVDLDRLLARGALHARVPDLSRWSRLAGVPIAGRLDLKAGLGAERGQTLDLTLNGDRLAYGSGGSRVGIGHLAATARLGDLLSAPVGKAQASLTNAAFPSGGLASASLKLDGSRPGRFAFTADAKGKLVDPLTLRLGGDLEVAPQGAGVDIRLARLTGSFGAEHFQLTRPLRLSQRGTDLALADLTLTLGPGRITGSAARRGQALSLQLAARNLSIASAARLLGYHDVGGSLTFDASIGGTVASPQGSFKVSGRELRFALPKQPRVPVLGLDLDGRWNGREIALNGKVSGLKRETIELTGSVPLVLRPAPLAVSMPPQGRLALRIEGAGELANLADLLPFGEDRISGRFALDVSLGGTVAAPSASGHLTVSDGRYENFATGAVLTKVKIELAGDRDRLTLREFSAGDSADGSLGARGSLGLSAAAPAADLTVTLKHFRVAARDEMVMTASGDVAVSGMIASPKVTARLTAERGDITLPDRLPPSVVRLKIVEINSRDGKGTDGKRPARPAKKTETPALLATLDLDLAVPGRVFVRGRGLDSEWGGRLKITGTSAAPQIAGSLDAQRGTFDVLGKTFKITRGRIAFDGGASLDPAIDILAEVSGGDVTAQVLVGGLISSPTITLTSTPTLPQDEILARVLFNRGVGQITAAQGIQVAQTAATLAGGGSGVLDRIRSRVGLDRLVFGAAPSGTASGNPNPASGGSAASGTAVSGGKYVAEGVYVGATQGLTPQSGKVTVEIEVRPNVTVETELGQTSGTGIGLNYKYDY